MTYGDRIDYASAAAAKLLVERGIDDVLIGYAILVRNLLKLADDLRHDLLYYGDHGQGCSAAHGKQYRCRCGWGKVEV